MKNAIAKIALPALALVLSLSCLTACGKSTKTDNDKKKSAETSKTSSETPASSEEMPMPPTVKLKEDYKKGGNEIQVPFLVDADGKQNKELKEMNAAILKFAGNYDNYVGTGNALAGSWMTLRCFPFLNEKFVQIVMTKNTFPNYANDGNIRTFLYDYQLNQYLPYDECLTQSWGSDAFDIAAPRPNDKMRKALEAPAGAKIKATIAGGLYSQLGDLQFLKVTVRPKNNDPYKTILTELPDGGFKPFDSDKGKPYFGNRETELIKAEPAAKIVK